MMLVHRKRHRLSVTETEAFERVFAAKTHPSRETLAFLSSRFNVPMYTVRIWFQNRRQRQRRLEDDPATVAAIAAAELAATLAAVAAPSTAAALTATMAASAQTASKAGASSSTATNAASAPDMATTASAGAAAAVAGATAAEGVTTAVGAPAAAGAPADDVKANVASVVGAIARPTVHRATDPPQLSTVTARLQTSPPRGGRPLTFTKPSTAAQLTTTGTIAAATTGSKLSASVERLPAPASLAVPTELGPPPSVGVIAVVQRPMMVSTPYGPMMLMPTQAYGGMSSVTSSAGTGSAGGGAVGYYPYAGMPGSVFWSPTGGLGAPSAGPPVPGQFFALQGPSWPSALH